METRGDILEVEVTVEGYLPECVDPRAASGVERRLAPINLKRGVALRVEVTDPAGAPVPGAWIDVYQQDGGISQRGESDAGGAATVTGLRPNVVAGIRVVAERHDEWSGSEVLPGPGVVVQARLIPFVALEGEVRYEDGMPAGMVRISAYQLGGDERDRWLGAVYADNAGRYRMYLPPGDLRIELEAPGVGEVEAPPSRRIAVFAGRKNRASFTLPRR